MLNVAEMLDNKGVKVFYAPLEDNILGKTYFVKERAEVYRGHNIVDFLMTKPKL